MQQRVAVWGTGNMGSTAIRSALAFPGLALSGIITSSDSKEGMDAAEFVGLDSPTGVTATKDVDAALALCDAVAYMASGDIRPEEAVNDNVPNHWLVGGVVLAILLALILALLIFGAGREHS